MNSQFEKPLAPPFRSVAVALLFCVALGPVGLLYASLTGGVVLMLVGLYLLRAKLLILLGVVWLVSCVWGVAAIQRYNGRLYRGY